MGNVAEGREALRRFECELIGSACRTVGQGAVQLHGAMGVTEELAVGRFFRRATQIELMFGSSGQHLRRIDRLQAPSKSLNHSKL